MIRWNTAELARLMREGGIENPRHLADEAGLTLPTAYAIVKRTAPLERLDCIVLSALATYFRVSPWTLLIYEPD